MRACRRFRTAGASFWAVPQVGARGWRAMSHGCFYRSRLQRNLARLALTRVRGHGRPSFWRLLQPIRRLLLLAHPSDLELPGLDLLPHPGEANSLPLRVAPGKTDEHVDVSHAAPSVASDPDWCKRVGSWRSGVGRRDPAPSTSWPSTDATAPKATSRPGVHNPRSITSLMTSWLENGVFSEQDVSGTHAV